MRTVVVLPAPFGPSSGDDGAGGHVEVEVVDGDEVAEALGEAVGRDGEVGSHGSLRAVLAVTERYSDWKYSGNRYFVDRLMDYRCTTWRTSRDDGRSADQRRREGCASARSG